MGRVVAVHPEDNSVDLVMLDNGMRMPGVQVLSASASSNTGTHDLPDPGAAPSGDVWSLTEETLRDITAVCGALGGQLLALGFLFPQVNGMLFRDRNRKVTRHASDVYTTVDGDGNMEICHPSGFYMRIGVGSAHEDLTGKDADGRWAIPAKPANIDFTMAMGGNVMSCNVKPSGAITIKTASTVTVEAAGAATVKASAVTVDAPQSTFTGKVTVAGLLTFNGGMTGKAGAGGGVAATITGDLLVDNISSAHHTHIEQGDGQSVSQPR